MVNMCNQRIRKAFAALLALLTVLSWTGCHREEQPEVGGPQYWESMPALTYGVMEYDKLEILPWYGARAEETSHYRMIETEEGFYLLSGSFYFYADKADLHNWVLVCSKPDCDHLNNCTGHIFTNSIMMKDGRLLYETASGSIPELYLGEEHGPVLVSASVSGTDRKVERTEPDVLLSSEGSIASVFSPGEWLVQKSEMQTDGTFLAQWFRITDAGIEEFHRQSGLGRYDIQGGFSFAKSKLSVHGDEYYYDAFLDPSGTKIFRFVENELQWLDLAGLEVSGGYLSENTLRVFRPNDGYYDVDLETRQEVLLAPPQLENSCAVIVLPNCILESTLLSMDSRDYRTQGMQHSMLLYDGQRWRSVALPAELLQAGQMECLFVHAVSSDSIFLRWFGGFPNAGDPLATFYRIDLTEEELALEFCGQVFEPSV